MKTSASARCRQHLPCCWDVCHWQQVGQKAGGSEPLGCPSLAAAAHPEPVRCVTAEGPGCSARTLPEHAPERGLRL